MNRREFVTGLVALPALARPALAEVSAIRLGKQYGLPFLPQMVMEDHRLIEAHAASLGAMAEKVSTIGELEQALRRAKLSDRTHVIVIQTDPAITTEAGGAWWDVAIPEVSVRAEVRAARAAYVDQIKKRKETE